jgi:hypothetical protein
VVSRHPVNGDAAHSNSPARFAPWCSRYRVVQPLFGEGECVASCRQSAPHCILRVTATQVADAVMELLPGLQPQGLSAGDSAPFIEPSHAAGALVLA